MAFIPGADGNKSVFGDGIQVDHISENSSGHGVSIAGRSNGVTVESGLVGQVVAGSTITSTTVTSEVTVSTITLPAGVWQMFFYATLYYNSGTSVSDRGVTWAAIKDATGTTIIGNTRRIVLSKTVAAGVFASNNVTVGASCVVNVSSSTNYLLRCKSYDIQGTATNAGIQNDTSFDYQAESIFYAVRIA